MYLLCRGVVAGAQVRPTQATQTQAAPAPTLPAPPPHPAELRFLVVLDPAHGGTDPGALLSVNHPEKDYTLDLAIRVHALLNAHGIHSILTRSGDTVLDNDARATIADRAHASACVLIHASSTGNGVHLFTSSLAPVASSASPQDTRRSFLQWKTAQASYATQSLRLESDVNAALTRDHVPVLLARTSLMPLDNMACPAVAVEVAPLDAKTPLTDAAYEEQIAAALSSALLAWRSDWRMQP